MASVTNAADFPMAAYWAIDHTELSHAVDCAAHQTQAAAPAEKASPAADAPLETTAAVQPDHTVANEIVDQTEPSHTIDCAAHQAQAAALAEEEASLFVDITKALHGDSQAAAPAEEASVAALINEILYGDSSAAAPAANTKKPVYDEDIPNPYVDVPCCPDYGAYIMHPKLQAHYRNEPNLGPMPRRPWCHKLEDRIRSLEAKLKQREEFTSQLWESLVLHVNKAKGLDLALKKEKCQVAQLKGIVVEMLDDMDKCVCGIAQGWEDDDDEVGAIDSEEEDDDSILNNVINEVYVEQDSADDVIPCGEFIESEEDSEWDEDEFVDCE